LTAKAVGARSSDRPDGGQADRRREGDANDARRTIGHVDEIDESVLIGINSQLAEIADADFRADNSLGIVGAKPL
jgi:hypothetical protein